MLNYEWSLKNCLINSLVIMLEYAPAVEVQVSSETLTRANRCLKNWCPDRIKAKVFITEVKLNYRKLTAIHTAVYSNR